MSRARTIWKSGFAVLFTGLLLGAIEISLGLLGVADPATGLDGEPLDLRVYETDPLLLWRLRRDAILTAPEDGFPGIRTNASGLRAPEVPTAPSVASEFRVLCLGDSVTFGLGLSDSETYPALLRVALERRLPGRIVRVVNAGVPGHSLVQGARLFDELRAMRPDVALCWYGLNDAKPAMDRPDAELSVPAGSFGRVAGGLRSLRLFRAIDAVVNPAAPPGTPRSTPAQTAALAAAIADSARKDGFAALFVRGATWFPGKAAQMERLLASARSAGATEIEGSERCLSMYGHAPRSAETIATTRTDAGHTLLCLAAGPGARVRRAVPAIEAELDELRRWTSRYDAHLAALPADSVPSAALIHDDEADAAFVDSVHLTPSGAALVADRLAEIVLRAAQERSRAR